MILYYHDIIILEPIKYNGKSVIETYKRDTDNLKSFIFKQQKLFN